MIERTLQIAYSHQDADRIARQQDNQVTPLERLESFMKLMEPHYAAASGLQRICRIDDRRQRQIRDDWERQKDQLDAEELQRWLSKEPDNDK